MFVNRKKELSIMDAYWDYIASGKQINLALFGLRRIGKTELLLKFKEKKESRGILIPYLNMQKIVPDLNNFSKQFFIELLYTMATLTKKVEKPVTWDDLLVLATQCGELEGVCVAKASNILNQRKVDETAVLDMVFSFPEKIAEKHDCKILFMIDEFQEILHVQKGILRIMRAITEKQKDVNYWVSGSVFTVFEELFGYKNPFFGQFKKMKLTGFDRGSSHELIEGLLPVTMDTAQKNTIYDFTGGQPYYITAICERVIQEYAIQKEMDGDSVNYCIIQELFGETGKINEHFEYLMDVSLSRFTNKDMYKKMLLYLSRQPDTLSGVSRYMGMPSGEVYSYVKTLLKTDLIVRDGTMYRVRDPVFEGWISKFYLGLDRFTLRDKTVFEKVFSELQEKYVRASSELGKAKEYEFKSRLEEKMGVRLKQYVTPDGQIEFDLVGTKKGIVYIFEIKWRNRPVSIRDIIDFMGKVKRSDFWSRKRRLFVVSKSGFDTKTLETARENKIICLDKYIDEIRT